MNKRENNNTIHRCMFCGCKLTKNEYYIGDDMCFGCRNVYYKRLNKDYVDTYGSNKIDIILENKVRQKKGV